MNRKYSQLEITNSEKRILTALRVLKPFFYKKLYRLSDIDYDCRDGDYLVFTTGRNGKTFFISLFPIFGIYIYKKLNHYMSTRKQPLNLLKEKEKYEDFKDLPGTYRSSEELQREIEEHMISGKNMNKFYFSINNDELKQVLMGYTQFIEKHFL